MKIAIIGGGPAGAMAAARLACRGASVTLFDPSHPREKPCGGGVTGRALALVSDLIAIDSLPSVHVTYACVDGAAQTAVVQLKTSESATGGPLLVVSRAVFDLTLVDAAIRAGARLIPERVVDIAPLRHHMTVRTTCGQREFDYVLGADGVNSIVRKKLAKQFTRAELSVTAGYYVYGPASAGIAVQTTSAQPGYLWSFPRTDHLAVGVCAAADHHVSSGKLRSQTAAWIAQHGFNNQTQLVPYAWPIPSIGHQRKQEIHLSGPGWMLLGDAAGLVDPLTREGIYYALLSGQWAADALSTSGASCAAPHYADKVLQDIQPELAAAARLSRLFFTEAFSSLLVQALRDSESVRAVFVDLVSGMQPYRGLARRLLGTREWTLALRAIRMLSRSGFTGTMSTVALPHEI